MFTATTMALCTTRASILPALRSIPSFVPAVPACGAWSLCQVSIFQRGFSTWPRGGKASYVVLDSLPRLCRILMLFQIELNKFTPLSTNPNHRVEIFMDERL